MKKIFFACALILVLSVLSLVFVSCEDAVDPPATYVVTFDKQGGSGGSESVSVAVDATMPTATAPIWTGHTFGGYYTEIDGGGTQYYTASMGNAKNWDKTSATTLYAKWTFNVYTGPSGGWVFYENPNYVTDGWRFLETAPSDIAIGHTFGFYRTDSGGPNEMVGTNTGIGTGQANTTALVNKMGITAYTSNDLDITTTRSDYAAKLCADLSVSKDGVTYADWFLPSKDELNLMYQNLKKEGLGDFTDSHYWSSSETSKDMAKGQNFDEGEQISSFRYVGGKSRPIRAF